MSDNSTKQIIAQTASVRIIRCPPSTLPEASHKAPAIIVEQRRRDAMGEAYWSLVGELNSESSEMGRVMQTFFNESGPPTKQLDLAVETSLGKLPLVERHAYQPPSRHMLGIFLIELSAMVVAVEPGAVISGMPFDNRDNTVGISIDPGLMATLKRFYPKLGPVGILIEVLKNASREMAGD